MKKQYQGVLIYLAVLIGMMWIFGQFAEKQKADTAYSYTQFVEAVEAGEVRSAQISQNKEVPTGNVVFTLVNGEQKNTNLPDVTKAEAQLIAGGVDVSDDHWTSNAAFPYGGNCHVCYDEPSGRRWRKDGGLWKEQSPDAWQGSGGYHF